MKLYHGSTVIIEKPNLEILNYRTDFGRGFYTTTDIEPAKKWTKIKKDRLERQNNNDIHKYINVYEYIEDSDLKIKDFTGADEEWLKFIYSNRQSDELIHDYDIVKGPVANDNLYQVLVGYENGIYNMDETIQRLKTYLLTNQISFHTQKTINCLKYIETIEVID